MTPYDRPQADPSPREHPGDGQPRSAGDRPDILQRPEARRRDPASLGDRIPWIVLGLAVALHLGLLVYFTEPSLWSATEPVLVYDYALHVYQVDRAFDAFNRWGTLWSYDPFVLAGQPANISEDLTTKSAELFAIALRSLGVSLAAAVNLYVLCAYLGLPFAAFASARLFGTSRRVAALSSVVWVLVWYFDSLFHWCWFVGMISWATASYLAVLVVALAYRAVRSKRPGHYGLLLLLSPLLCIVHPFAVITVAPPLAIIYVRAFSTLSRREHALLWVGVLLSAATAALWVGPALRFWHYLGEVDAFLRPGPKAILFDAFDLVDDVLMTGEPVRTLLRFVLLVAGVAGLIRLHRRRDERVLVWGTLIGVGFAVGYFGGAVPGLLQTQPYRQLAPATLVASLPALIVLTEWHNEQPIREMPWERRVVLCLLLVIALPRLGRTVLTYMPTLLPVRVAHTGMDLRPPVPPPLPEELPTEVKGLRGPSRDHVDVRHFLEAHHGGRGRVVAFDWPLGEYLATFTTIPTLGGIPQRNVPHIDAHPHRHLAPTPAFDERALERYLTTYAAGWVVFMGPTHPAEAMTRLLTHVVTFGQQRLYRVVPEPSYVARGHADSVRQELGSITVTGARGPELVLRFHWMDGLRCRPDCAIQPFAIEGDRAGFIHVEEPPEVFEIDVAYD